MLLETNHKVLRLNSIVLAFYASIPAFVLVLTAIIPRIEGVVLIPLYLFSCSIIILTACINLAYNRNSLNGLGNPKLITLVAIILVYYIFTKAIVESSLLLTDFLAYTVLPLLLPSLLRFDKRYFLIYLQVIPSIGIFFLDRIFILGGYYENTITMGTSYAFLIPIISSILYVFYYLKYDSGRAKILMLCVIIANTMFLFRIAMYGSRGPLLSIILLLLFIYVCKWKNYKVYVNKRRLFQVILAILVVIALFISILIGLSEYLESKEIQIKAVDKILQLYESGDISNGRNSIISATLAKIPERLLFGHGLSTSESILSINYAHNCIIQSLFDGGIFLTFVIFSTLFYNLYKKWKHISYDSFVIMVLFLSAAFPSSLISSDMWNNPRFWFLVGFIIINNDSLISRRLFDQPCNINS